MWLVVTVLDAADADHVIIAESSAGLQAPLKFPSVKPQASF